MNRSWFRLPFGGGGGNNSHAEDDGGIDGILEEEDQVDDSGELLPSSSRLHHRNNNNNGRRSKASNSSGGIRRTSGLKQSISRPCQLLLLSCHLVLLSDTDFVYLDHPHLDYATIIRIQWILHLRNGMNTCSPITLGYKQ